MIEKLLGTYLDANRHKMFNWRQWNCVHFTGAWVETVEGPGVLAHYTEQTDTPLRAAHFARELGGLHALVCRVLDRAPVPAMQAGVGDIVYSPSGGVAGTLAICNGASAVALSPVKGYMPVPMSSFTTAWKLRREA